MTIDRSALIEAAKGLVNDVVMNGSDEHHPTLLAAFLNSFPLIGLTIGYPDLHQIG